MAVLLALGLLVHRKRLLQTQSHLKAERKQLREATQRLNYLMASSPAMFYTVQVNGPKVRISWISNNIERLLGYTTAQAMGNRWWRQHLHPDDAELATANISRLHLTKAVHHQFRFAHADGTYRWFDNEVHLLDSHTENMEALGVWRDITESKQQEDELQLAASVFDNSYDGIIITDAQHRIVDVNPAFIRITGLSESEVHGLPLVALALDDALPEFRGETPPNDWMREMPLALSAQGQGQGEVVLRRHNGQPMACALSASVVHGAHQGPTTGHHVVVFSDISHIKAHQTELDRLAHYDPLTGVPNRRMLVDRLAQAVERSRRSGKTLAVCYLDLDDFKPVNDRLGHAMGDQLLISMTHRLQGILRAQDTLARLGGDEFVLLLADMNLKTAVTRSLPADSVAPKEAGDG
jgi:PAS domain S-box-containing protein